MRNIVISCEYITVTVFYVKTLIVHNNKDKNYMMRGKTKFALIWWVDSSYKDVVPLLRIPKKLRNVGDTTSLSWKDYKTNKMIKADAKILAIDCEYL